MKTSLYTVNTEAWAHGCVCVCATNTLYPFWYWYMYMYVLPNAMKIGILSSLCFLCSFKHASSMWIRVAILGSVSIHQAVAAGSMLHSNRREIELCLLGHHCFE